MNCIHSADITDSSGECTFLMCKHSKDMHTTHRATYTHTLARSLRALQFIYPALGIFFFIFFFLAKFQLFAVCCLLFTFNSSRSVPKWIEHTNVISRQNSPTPASGERVSELRYSWAHCPSEEIYIGRTENEKRNAEDETGDYVVIARLMNSNALCDVCGCTWNGSCKSLEHSLVQQLLLWYFSFDVALAFDWATGTGRPGDRRSVNLSHTNACLRQEADNTENSVWRKSNDGRCLSTNRLIHRRLRHFSSVFWFAFNSFSFHFFFDGKKEEEGKKRTNAEINSSMNQVGLL